MQKHYDSFFEKWIPFAQIAVDVWDIHENATVTPFSFPTSYLSHQFLLALPYFLYWYRPPEVLLWEKIATPTKKNKYQQRKTNANKNITPSRFTIVVFSGSGEDAKPLRNTVSGVVIITIIHIYITKKVIHININQSIINITKVLSTSVPPKLSLLYHPSYHTH